LRHKSHQSNVWVMIGESRQSGSAVTRRTFWDIVSSVSGKLAFYCERLFDWRLSHEISKVTSIPRSRDAPCRETSDKQLEIKRLSTSKHISVLTSLSLIMSWAYFRPSSSSWVQENSVYGVTTFGRLKVDECIRPSSLLSQGLFQSKLVRLEMGDQMVLRRRHCVRWRVGRERRCVKRSLYSNGRKPPITSPR
jgi:hypothetical protein